MILFSSSLPSFLPNHSLNPDSNAANSKLLLRIDPSMAPPLLPFAWIVGILLALCVTHHRKPSKPHPHPQSPPNPSRSSTSTETRSPPPAPPERHPAQSGESPVGTPGRERRRGLSLSASASARVPERIAARMRARRRERKERSAEESIWMKTIILGERCRVPSDDDDNNDNDNENGGGGLNGRGWRPRHYRPRTPRSVPVSRTSSFLDLEDAAASDAFGAGD